MRRACLHVRRTANVDHESLIHDINTSRKVRLMFWKMMNLQLKKGYTFPLYGDSAPIFRKICRGADM